MKNRKTMAAEYIRGKVLKQAGNINAYYHKAMEAAAKAAVCFESGDIYEVLIENKAPKGPAPLTNRGNPLEDTISIEEMMSGVKDRKQQDYILKPVIIAFLNTRQFIYADKKRIYYPAVKGADSNH